jgi:hypothetical protein
MKAIEFESQLNPDQTLTVPPTVAASVPMGKKVRVLILISEDDGDPIWEEMAAAEFGRSYAESDNVYDQLSGG